jgi:hypothetical protein
MNAVSVRFIRRRTRILSQKPFARLVRHCIDRMFYGGEHADAGELNFGIGTIFAILALPGAFVSIAMADKYSSLLRFVRGEATHFDPYTASLSDEYFFIVLSMLVTSAVAVWKWDRLLPDRRDYANLAPLPIPSRDIFLANLSALLLLAGILSLDINAASSVFFPLIACGSSESASYVLTFFESHLLSVILASAFSFLAVLGILGTLMTLLPYRVFRKVSVYVRCAVLIFFMALLTTSISVPRKIYNLPHVASSWTKLPPSAWFVGLCQSLRGRGDPLFNALAIAAIVASTSALALAFSAYALSYRRCFVRSADMIASLPAGGGTGPALAFRLLDTIVLRTSFQRAGYRFVMKTLFRSESHLLALGGFTGAGIIFATQILLVQSAKSVIRLVGFPSVELLSVPFVLSYFLMYGLRFAFEIPAPLRANWLFRMGVDPGTRECATLARKVILTFEIPPLAAFFGAYAYFWGWRVAAIHIVIVAVSCVLLLETLLMGFRKIPFTCSTPPFRSNVIVLSLLYVLGFFAFAQMIASVEHQAFENPFPFSFFIFIVLVAWGLCLHQWRKNMTDNDCRLIFEERQTPAVEVLDLTFRS